MYATSMTERNVLKATLPDSMVQWCSRDRNLRDRDLAQISRRDQDRDFVIKAETETETWKFEIETSRFCNGN